MSYQLFLEFGLVSKIIVYPLNGPRSVTKCNSDDQHMGSFDNKILSA